MPHLCWLLSRSPEFLGNQILLSLGPRLTVQGRITAGTPLGLCHSQPLTSSRFPFGIIAGFNPFRAKLLTIPYHSISTFKESTSPLAFLSSKFLAVWFSNFVFNHKTPFKHLEAPSVKKEWKCSQRCLALTKGSPEVLRLQAAQLENLCQIQGNFCYVHKLPVLPFTKYFSLN